jgi:hypothetical protein
MPTGASCVFHAATTIADNGDVPHAAHLVGQLLDFIAGCSEGVRCRGALQLRRRAGRLQRPQVGYEGLEHCVGRRASRCRARLRGVGEEEVGRLVLAAAVTDASRCVPLLFQNQSPQAACPTQHAAPCQPHHRRREGITYAAAAAAAAAGSVVPRRAAIGAGCAAAITAAVAASAFGICHAWGQKGAQLRVAVGGIGRWRGNVDHLSPRCRLLGACPHYLDEYGHHAVVRP